MPKVHSHVRPARTPEHAREAPARLRRRQPAILPLAPGAATAETALPGVFEPLAAARRTATTGGAEFRAARTFHDFRATSPLPAVFMPPSPRPSAPRDPQQLLSREIDAIVTRYKRREPLAGQPPERFQRFVVPGLGRYILTSFPQSRREGEQLLREAASNAPPGVPGHVVSLIHRDDLDHEHYIDRLAPGKPTKSSSGRWTFTKQDPGIRIILGPNNDSHPEPVTLKRTLVRIQDNDHPERRPAEVIHDRIDGWVDGETLPAVTLRALQRATRDRHALVHCYAGIGRTATLVLAQLMRDYVRQQNARGRQVAFKELTGQLENWIDKMRALRGPNMADIPAQLETLVRLAMDIVNAQGHRPAVAAPRGALRPQVRPAANVVRTA